MGSSSCDCDPTRGVSVPAQVWELLHGCLCLVRSGAAGGVSVPGSVRGLLDFLSSFPPDARNDFLSV